MRKFLIWVLASVGALSILSAGFMILAISSFSPKNIPLQDKVVLYIDFSSSFSESPQQAFGLSFDPHQISIKELTDAINHASKDDRVVGIIARIDEAKVNLTQVEEIRKAITMFRANGFEKGKFAIAHSYGFGAAGPSILSYYLASSFGEIHLQPLGGLYLGGVNIEIPYIRELLDEYKIKPDFHRREEYKSGLDFATNKSMSHQERESWTAVLKSQLGSIVSDIAASRELTPLEINQVIDESPILGERALALGLIDRLSYFDEIKSKVKDKYGKNIPFVSIEKYEAHIKPATHNPKTPVIALIYGVGEIVQKSNIYPHMDSTQLSAIHIAKAIEQASANPKVQVIVLRIDSPGGSPEASETVARSIKIAQKAGKPVVVSMGSVAASGGYWIAAGSDMIFANANTITGSIGVLAGKVVTQDAWKHYGVNWDSISIGKNAKMWSSSSEFDEHAKKKLDEQLDYLYKQFIARVAKGRQLPVAQTHEIAKGRIWTGEQAIKLGLVDQLGGLNEAIEFARIEYKIPNASVVVMPTPKSPSELILEQLIGDPVDEIHVNASFGQWFGKQILSGFVSAISEQLNMIKTQTMKLDMPKDKL